MKPRHVWNSPLRLIPVGMLVSNTGNGMYLLAVSVLMYHQFGGPSAFAWLLVLQTIAVVMTQALASVGSDAGHSKALAATAEFARGALVLLGAILAGQNHPEALFVVGLALAFVQPFYRTPIFAIGPLVAQGDKLARYNARNATYQQVGQFLGAAAAGGLMQVSELLPLYINSASYVFSGLMVALSLIEGQSARLPLRQITEAFRPAAVSRMWLAGIVELWKTQTTLRLTVLCAADFLVINWLNTIYAPLLAQLSVSHLWISWWDTTFALGALVGANLVGRLSVLRRNLLVLPIILVAEGVSLLGVGQLGAWGTLAAMASVGVLNAMSVSLFTYFIQISSRVEMAGRSSGMRQLSIALLGMLTLPSLSRVANADVPQSAMVLCVALVAIAAVAHLMLRGRTVASNAPEVA